WRRGCGVGGAGAARACGSRAASTTWAPAAAMAAAVAAPIPRLAPVTTASRPASHLTEEAGEASPGKRCTASPTGHSPVKALVRVQAPFQVKPDRGVLAAGGPG